MKIHSRPQVKKILITAYIGSENLGDEAIFESLARDLMNKDIEITAVSKNPVKTRKIGVHAVKLFSLQFIRALQEARLVLLGGGGILQDETSIYNIPYFVLQVLFAQLLRKKIMFVAIGAGPIKGITGRSLTALSLKKTAAITVRDSYSYDLLKSLGAEESKMHLVADPAITLSFNEGSFDARTVPPKFTANNYIVVCLRHWFDLNRFLPVALSYKLKLLHKGKRQYQRLVATCAECLDSIIEETSLSVIFFPFHGHRDIRVSRDTHNAMLRRDKAFLIPEPQQLSTFCHLAKNAHFVISMRLHSAILSAAQYTPSIALSYSIKVQEFMKSLEMERFSLNLSEINPHTMLPLVKEILQNRSELCAKIKKHTEKLQAAHKKNIAIILDHI